MVAKGCSPSDLLFVILLFLNFCFGVNFPLFIVPFPFALVFIPVYPLSLYTISFGLVKSIAPSWIFAVVKSTSLIILLHLWILRCSLKPKKDLFPFFVHVPSLLRDVSAFRPRGAELKIQRGSKIIKEV